MSYLGNTENFDAAATTPTDERIVRKIIPFFTERYANPESSNSQSRKVRTIISEAAAKVAGSESLLCRPEDVVFTSGGTESNNTVILGYPYSGKTVCVSATEHKSVLLAAEKISGYQIVPVDENGIINLVVLEEILKTGTIGLVSVHAVNNETGAIQPILSIKKLCEAYGANLHTDASQYWGKEKALLNADYITISGHKVHAPKGIGAFISREGTPQISPLLVGGGHQKGRRAGTLAVPLIVGLGLATQYFYESYDYCQRIKTIRDTLIDDFQMYGNVGINSTKNSQALFLNISLRDAQATDVIADMEYRYGIVLSRGSACMEGKRSHVIGNMRGKSVSDAENSIRISLSKFNKTVNLMGLANMIENSIEVVRKQDLI